MGDLGNKEIFSKNLNYYMQINNKSRTDLSRDLDIPYSTITDWCNANIYPRIDRIEMLANYFEIKKSDLVENKDKKDEFGNQVTSIPILGTVKAGYNYLAQENWIGSVDVEKLLVGNGEDYIALKIHGESMSPILIEDDIVIIKKQDDFENGDIVVVLINGDEATIKKGKKTSEGIELHAINPYYPDRKFTYEEMKSIPVNIIGVVKKLHRDL